jgi:4-carboxymuconolactone decarboxylase
LSERLASLGGRPVNLYRALANQPDVLAAWMEFAWALRLKCRSPREVRELMILRQAQAFGSEYEWAHHRAMALSAGVTEDKIEVLARWRDSELFSGPERAVLAYAEGVLDGEVAEPVAAELARWFAPAEVIELTVTAGFYAMVPRVLDALGVPLETDG